jgi:hypothetical protein
LAIVRIKSSSPTIIASLSWINEVKLLRAVRLGFEPAATIPTPDFKPGVHVNYAETVLPMKDGLPRFKDFPKEFGGSGEMASE